MSKLCGSFMFLFLLAGMVGARPLAYVPNPTGDLIAVFDTATNERLDNLAIGDFPIAAAVTPDGTRLYVSSANDRTV